MKGIIKFDFAKMFFYQKDVRVEAYEDLVEVDYHCVEEFSKGDEVEILKEIEGNHFSGGKGYVIYNPKNHASTVVACHVLDILVGKENSVCVSGFGQ